MAKIMKGERAEKMEDLVVYCIISPFAKQFFINKTGANRLRKAYTEHYCGRVKKTKALFEQAKTEGLLPPVHILESKHMSRREAFRYCVAWTKYFLEYGYTQITEDILTEYANDLVPYTQRIYEGIKYKTLEEVLTPKEGCLPRYNVRKGEPSNRRVISFKVLPEQHKRMKDAAGAEGLSLNAYCIKEIKNGSIINVDFQAVQKALDELKEDKDLMKEILYKVYTTKEYSSSDTKNIECFVEHIGEVQDGISKKIEEQIQALRK